MVLITLHHLFYFGELISLKKIFVFSETKKTAKAQRELFTGNAVSNNLLKCLQQQNNKNPRPAFKGGIHVEPTAFFLGFIQ